MAKIGDPLTAISWRTGWFCLTIRDRLAEDGQHVTVDLPDLSVTVQNFRGSLRGYWNVCSHRGTQMRHAGYGMGPLRCPYHGWVYNAEGIPIGIPDNELLFDLDAAARRQLALRSVEVEPIGRLVFVQVESGSESLIATLGDCAKVLAATPAPGHRLIENTGGPQLGEVEETRFRNLWIRADPRASSIEITLPTGRQGVETSCFDFAAPQTE
jgi:phenylpropionate dioxygenase-like ring-hydroxylating dioxygenase large terminal subunit